MIFEICDRFVNLWPSITHTGCGPTDLGPAPKDARENFAQSGIIFSSGDGQGAEL